MKVELKTGEVVDIIPGSYLKIIQNRERFSYGTDAILLSSFVNIKKNSKIIDLGTGTGIIPLFLYSRHKTSKIYGIEIQDEVANMAKRSISLNDLDEDIEILHMDLKQLPDKFEPGEFQVVTSNPPYIQGGGGIVNIKDNFALSRHEIACNLEDIIKIASYLLNGGGKFYLVHRPSRLVDIFCLLREYRLEPKTIRLVYPKKGKAPNMVLIMSTKGGRTELKFENPLYVYGEDGNYTDEVYKLYGMDVEKNE